MTWVKICGITNPEDALAAVKAGADALGFVFYDKSPRKADPEITRQIVERLPARIEKVGVFVDSSPVQICDLVAKTKLTCVQLHGEPAQHIWKDLRAREQLGASKFIPAFPGNSLDGVLAGKLLPVDVFAVLLDSQRNGSAGGTGIPFDWQAAQSAVQSIARLVPTIVAGGLTPANVAQAIRILKPWGVDVASGVEAHPGKKDLQKLRAFISAVREADKELY